MSNKIKNYYVVTHGLRPGIYKDYNKANNQIYKVKGSKMKKFNNLLDAQIYFKNNKQKNKKTKTNIYIDGSYNPETKCYGSGVVIVKNKKVIEIISKKGCKQKYIQYNQIAGELYACVLALKWANKHNIKNINIYYDFEGVYKWITGQSKARINIAQDYKSQVTPLIQNINVNFIKIKSHSGNVYNEIADKVAKNITQSS